MHKSISVRLFLLMIYTIDIIWKRKNGTYENLYIIENKKSIIKGIPRKSLRSINVVQAINSNVKIIDIGLLPRQIMATQRGMFIQSFPDLATAAKQLSREIRQNFTSEELAWLDAGNFVELESFTPQILIQVIRSGISGSSNLESDDSSMILMDNSGNDIYMVESFG